MQTIDCAVQPGIVRLDASHMSFYMRGSCHGMPLALISVLVYQFLSRPLKIDLVISDRGMPNMIE
jgi:hypothetical protein